MTPTTLSVILLLLLLNRTHATIHKNVLLLIADDMRPQLNETYGQPWMVTPNLDMLAKESLVFDAAYANFAICSASRNSFLSGRMPDKTRTWNFIDDFRRSGMSTLGPGIEWTSLPEFFKLQGYYTAGHGKVFHNHRPRRRELRAWTDTSPMVKTTCPHDFLFCPGSEGPSSGDYSDFTTARKAARAIERAGTDQPWFVAVGLHFPHITWAVPSWCVDVYSGISLNIAANRMPPTDCPDIAFTAEFDSKTNLTLNASEFRTELGQFGEGPMGWPVPTPLSNDVPESVDRLLRLGYYASITHSDWLFGNVLQAVEPVKNDTLVIFTSDHGFSLGEQGEWGKHTLFDNSIRIPLMVRAPWIPACQGRTTAFFELIDLYRTIVPLAGLDPALIEADVDGVDQSPIVRNTSISTIRDAAYAQYSRCPQSGEAAWHLNGCELVPAPSISVMGLSVRNETIRFTEWYAFDNCAIDFDSIIATELYTQQDPRLITQEGASLDFDDIGTVNIAGQIDTYELETLRFALRDRFETGVNFGCPPEY